MSKALLKSIYGLLFTLLCLPLLAVNYPSPPQPFRYVSDYTQTLTQQEWRTLENALVDYSQKTSSQIAVVIIPSTQGEEIARYSHTLFDKWGIGRKKENNGVLLLIAKQDRKLFIATGRGLEAALPDAIASSIIRHDITPYFKQNLYAEGIAKGLSAIIQATQGEYKPLDNTENNENDFDGLWVFIIAGIIIFLIFRPRNSDIYISPSQMEQLSKIARTGRHGGFGGGFGGGSSGGFGSGGGFGGGSTGGGGAGGSW